MSERAKEYLNTQNFNRYDALASYLLAQSYDKRGMREDAIRAYNNVFGGFTGYILVSAPAVKRIMELTWERGRSAEGEGKSDQQTAYEFGWNYIDSTDHIVSQMKDEEKMQWDQVQVLVQQYEDDPGVMKMEEVKKLRQQGR